MTSLFGPAIVPALGETFFQVVRFLRLAVDQVILKDPHRRPLILLIQAQLERRVARFRTLVARLEAGFVYRPRPSRIGEPRAVRQPEPKPSDQAVRFLRGRGCLMKMTHCTDVWKMTQGTGLCRSRLGALLEDPEMLLLLRTTPEAGRILRPLWRMICLDRLPEVLRPVPRPPATPPPTPAPPTQAPPTQAGAADGPLQACPLQTTARPEPGPGSGPAGSPPVRRRRSRRYSAGPALSKPA